MLQAWQGGQWGGKWDTQKMLLKVPSAAWLKMNGGYVGNNYL